MCVCVSVCIFPSYPRSSDASSKLVFLFLHLLLSYVLASVCYVILVMSLASHLEKKATHSSVQADRGERGGKKKYVMSYQ